ncbi:hypothetical protein C8E03_102623 [Lachnotalea glycerini]|uniref:Lipoprotein n=1 Tax=Lachnotalea glycerini TaxID=1763509 RepID=A0A255I3G6_9FIRM|nr:hypothetical protein [Lachnotalea glycerini]PXV93848.1 hypothetical protein C8E03_102623 [Lachnotalea glycerini]RDY30913.1 hypothetical protein CG710_012145 [Lachnotalea glycerini]
MIAKILFVMFGFVVLSFLSLSGCVSNISESKIEVGFSEFTGEKVQDIQLNDGITHMKLSGTISLTSGSVEIYIKVKDTDEKLYSETFFEENSGTINIEIKDLKGNSNFVLGIDSNSAKDFKLSLTSDQKLIKDKEKPAVPAVPK